MAHGNRVWVYVRLNSARWGDRFLLHALHANGGQVCDGYLFHCREDDQLRPSLELLNKERKLHIPEHTREQVRGG